MRKSNAPVIKIDGQSILGALGFRFFFLPIGIPPFLRLIIVYYTYVYLSSFFHIFMKNCARFGHEKAPAESRGGVGWLELEKRPCFYTGVLQSSKKYNPTKK